SFPCIAAPRLPEQLGQGGSPARTGGGSAARIGASRQVFRVRGGSFGTEVPRVHPAISGGLFQRSPFRRQRRCRLRVGQPLPGSRGEIPKTRLPVEGFQAVPVLGFGLSVEPVRGRSALEGRSTRVEDRHHG